MLTIIIKPTASTFVHRMISYICWCKLFYVDSLSLPPSLALILVWKLLTPSSPVQAARYCRAVATGKVSKVLAFTTFAGVISISLTITLYIEHCLTYFCNWVISNNVVSTVACDHHAINWWALIRIKWRVLFGMFVLHVAVFFERI